MIEESKKMTLEEMYSALDTEKFENLKLFTEHKQHLKHGEKDRLMTALILYPDVDEDFSAESLDMQRAYAAGKRVEDAKIAKTAEIVIQQLMKQQEEKEETNG